MESSDNLGFDFFKFNFEHISPKGGRLLIAQPELADPFFKRAVIFLIDHDKNGSMGFIINRQLNLNVSDIIVGFPDVDVNISVGGPVSSETINFLHTFGDSVPNSVNIGNGIYLNGDIEAIKGLAMANKLSKSNFRVFIGYSGWGAKQLSKEIKEDSWVVANFDPKQVMKGVYDNWYFAVQQLGKQFKPWTIYPENPSLN
ncbi:MAG: YqgE/AlgH family protein [Bacteroidales bacterium]